MDCPPGPQPALHLHRAGDPHPDRRSGGDPAHPDRHLPQHQYPRRLRRLAVHRPQPRGDWKAASPRPTRRPSPPSSTTSSTSNPPRSTGEAIVKVYLQPGASLDTRQRPGLHRLRSSCLKQLPPASCRRRSSTSPPPACPSCSSASPARTVRAAAQRLRRQLHPPAARHHPRRRPAQRLRRQAALHHDQSRPQRCCRPRASPLATSSTPWRSRTSSSPAAPPRSASSNTTSASTASPVTLAGHQRHPHQAGQWRDGLRARRRHRRRRLHPADQHRPPGWPPRRAPHRPQIRHRLHALASSTASRAMLPQRRDHSSVRSSRSSPSAISRSSSAAPSTASSAKPSSPPRSPA